MMVNKESALYYELKSQWTDALLNKQYHLADQLKNRIKRLKQWQKSKNKK